MEKASEAAANLLAALTPEQRATATFDLFDVERARWHYTPGPRGGLPLEAMNGLQQRLAFRLLACGLSAPGYATAATIIGLERVLDHREGFRRAPPGRDPSLYYVSIFGAPGPSRWAYRFEGHHVSLHYVLEGDRIVAPTPTFFGANPAETPLTGGFVLRPLGAVEDLARTLVHALDGAQRDLAILAPAAPPDIVLGNRPRVVEDPGAEGPVRFTRVPRGLAGAAMREDQREILRALVDAYLARMPEPVAATERAAIAAEGWDALHFAWAGALAPKKPHYYRLQSARFVVEYDNTQNDANHVHSVWRSPDGDFGGDLLAAHYARDH